MASPANALGLELGPSERRRVLANALIGSFLSSLSTSIVGVVLPAIRSWADVGVIDVQWVMLTPLVVVSSVLLPIGRLGDVYGHRRVYLAGTFITALGASLCLLAPGFTLFLLGRGIQGLGAAMLMAASPALVSLAAPPGRRGRSLGMISSSLYLGLTLGPPLGGFLAAFGGFRLVFGVQAALPFLLFLISLRLLPEVPAGRSRGGLDLGGALLLAVSIVSLLLGLSRVEAWGWHRALGLLLPALLVGLAFLAWERRRVDGLLDLRLFQDRTFASACAGAFLNYATIMLSTFLLPFYLVDMLGRTAREAGLFLMAMPLVMAMVAGPSGDLSDRLGSRSLSSLGLAISGCGVLGLLFVSPHAGQAPLLVCLAVQGLGTGLFVSPNTNALMSSAPRERQGVASGVMALCRNLGMVTGTALASLVFTMGRASMIQAGAETLDAGVRGLHLSYCIGGLLAFLGALVVLTRPESPKAPSTARGAAT